MKINGMSSRCPAFFTCLVFVVLALLAAFCSAESDQGRRLYGLPLNATTAKTSAKAAINGVSSLLSYLFPFPFSYLRPYGPQSFVAPHQQPDLTNSGFVIPIPYKSFLKGQKDCSHFIFQVKRLINSANQPNPQVWFNNGDTDNNTLAASLFNKDVNVRISPLGIFPGFKFAVQYYYALPLFWFPIKESIVDHLTCTGNVVSYRQTMKLVRPAGQNTSQWNIVQFDLEGKIKTIDALFYNLGALYDNSVWTPAGFIPEVNLAATQAISYVSLNGSTVTIPAGTYTYNLQDIYMICQITAIGYSSLSANQMNIPGGTCQGKNAIWNNTYGLSQFDYCMNWLQTKVPFGSWNWGNQNNTVCRLVHSQLTYFDPDDHCPHVGFGGQFCQNFPYNAYYPPGAANPLSVGDPENNSNY